MDEAEDDLEKAVDIEHKRRRSSIGGPEDVSKLYNNFSFPSLSDLY